MQFCGVVPLPPTDTLHTPTGVGGSGSIQCVSALRSRGRGSAAGRVARTPAPGPPTRSAWTGTTWTTSRGTEKRRGIRRESPGVALPGPPDDTTDIHHGGLPCGRCGDEAVSYGGGWGGGGGLRLSACGGHGCAAPWDGRAPTDSGGQPPSTSAACPTPESHSRPPPRSCPQRTLRSRAPTPRHVRDRLKTCTRHAVMTAHHSCRGQACAQLGRGGGGGREVLEWPYTVGGGGVAPPPPGPPPSLQTKVTVVAKHFWSHPPPPPPSNTSLGGGGSDLVLSEFKATDPHSIARRVRRGHSES